MFSGQLMVLMGLVVVVVSIEKELTVFLKTSVTVLWLKFDAMCLAY